MLGYLCISALIALLSYLPASIQAGDGAPLMPVDDAYIHFQYAHQIALGHPFVYVTGEPATSGATSLIYPWLLAAGWAAGFHNLSLGWVAVAIGVLGLACSAWVVDRFAHDFRAPFCWAWGIGFLICGAFMFHAVSGMETSLVVLLTLLTLLMFERASLRGFVLVASLLALSRPEGSLMAVIASGLYALRWARMRGMRSLPWMLVLPVLAFCVQPALNWVLTGSFSATGGQAKSLLSLIPADFTVIVSRILENFIRAWRELLIGRGDDGLWYLPPLWGLIALVGYTITARRRFWLMALVLLWALCLTGAISTLDTAFWHLKRYHMPLLALTFPGVALAVGALTHRQIRRSAALAGMVAAGFVGWPFAGYYAQNVASVAAQPLQMARWLSANAPGARVAVHDVGLIGYLGDVHTLDMVGLTTAGAADAWRNGPGAVGQFWMNPSRQPDLFAAYDDARGLSYLADALYGSRLAEFSAEFDPATNIALGGNTQGIYQPDWSITTGIEDVHTVGVQILLDHFADPIQVDQLDVADLDSEATHVYRWFNGVSSPGFATELYRQGRADCDGCLSVDGGRRINGGEHFTMQAQPNRDHLLITRVHSINGGHIRVLVDGVLMSERTLPVLPGQWLDVPTWIPASRVSGEQLAFEILSDIHDGHYMPYVHTLWAGTYQPDLLENPFASFAEGALTVGDLILRQQDDTLDVQLAWQSDGQPLPDGLIFVHLIDALDRPPVAQIDRRLGYGSLTPGMLISGVLRETYVLDLRGIPAGRYQVVMGVFDPSSFARWDVIASNSNVTVDNRRLVIAQIEVGE
jgi:hypothetical protein